LPLYWHIKKNTGTGSAYALPVFHILEKDRKTGGETVYRQRRRSIYKKWCGIFCVGLFVGIVFLHLGHRGIAEEYDFLDMTALKEMEEGGLDSAAFLRYELPRRLQSFVILFLLSTSCFGGAGSFLWLIWQGMMAGIMISAVITGFGWKGVLLILAGIFPQYFLFVPAAGMLLYWCYDKRGTYMQRLLWLLWILFVVVTGCIMECYVNPIWMGDIAGFL
jgi:hypothetical protein